MQIFKSLGNNLSLITFHLYTWIIRLLVVYISTIPLRSQMKAFFKSRTINEDMLAGLDVHGLFEYISNGFYTNTEYSFGILFGILIMLSILFLIIDPLIEAGFIGVLYNKDKALFWPSLKSKGVQLVLLKLILLIPNLIVIAGAIFAAITIGSPMFGYLEFFMIFLFVGTFFLFMYKLNDLAKYHLVIKDNGLGNALSFSFNKVFSQFGDSLILNVITAMLFYIGFSLGQMVDEGVVVASVGSVYFVTLIQQIFVLLKQILRYSFLDANMSMLPKTDEAIEEPNNDTHDDFEFNEMIKET